MQDLKRIRYSTLLNLFILSLILVLANIYEASAQRRGGGGGGGARHSIGSRGGGGAANRGAQMSNRGGSQARGGQAVQRGGSQARSGVNPGTASRPGTADRGAAGTANRDVGAGNRGDNINSNRNTNANRNNNINIDNDINIDADGGWDNDWDYHPIAAGVAFGTAAAITSAAIGSMYYSLPPSCAPRPYNSVSYYYCGNTWYQPAYSGTSVSYTVVNPPY